MSEITLARIQISMFRTYGRLLLPISEPLIALQLISALWLVGIVFCILLVSLKYITIPGIKE